MYIYVYGLSRSLPLPHLHQAATPDGTNIDNDVEPNITDEAVSKQESSAGSTSGILPVFFINALMINMTCWFKHAKTNM